MLSYARSGHVKRCYFVTIKLQACEDANYLQSPISISRKISFVFKVRRMDILPIQLRNRGLFFKIEKF